jgi:uncharacterized phiE125 gp8 family phage protein
MRFERITPPASLVVTLAEAKQYCRVYDTHDDGLIATMIEAATEALDAEHGILGRAIVTQTWSGVADAFPAGDVSLKYPRVQSIDAITYFDTSNAEQTLAPSRYELVADDGRAQVCPVGSGWPATFTRSDAVTITYTCGYGGPERVPSGLRLAIKLLVEHWYNSRGAATYASMDEIPHGIVSMTNRFRVGEVFL